MTLWGGGACLIWQHCFNCNFFLFFPSSFASYRPGMVFMHGDLNWDQLQIMISKSTAADLIKMYYKLDEFFSQQFKSSKRLFTSLQQDGSKPKNAPVAGGSSFRKRNPTVSSRKKVSSTLNDGTLLLDCKKCPLLFLECSLYSRIVFVIRRLGD